MADSYATMEDELYQSQDEPDSVEMMASLNEERHSKDELVSFKKSFYA